MFKQEGYVLMGAAFEIYNELGYGMAEEFYQAALEVELGLRGIRFTDQPAYENAVKQLGTLILANRTLTKQGG